MVKDKCSNSKRSILVISLTTDFLHRALQWNSGQQIAVLSVTYMCQTKYSPWGQIHNFVQLFKFLNHKEINLLRRCAKISSWDMWIACDSGKWSLI